MIDEHGSVVEAWRFIAKDEICPGKKYIEELVSRGRNIIAMQGIVYRTSVLQHGGFDATLSPHYGDLRCSRASPRSGTWRSCAIQSCKCAGTERRRVGRLPFKSGPKCGALRSWHIATSTSRRHPHDTAFVAKFRRAVMVRHQIALVWGWVSSEAPDDSRACAQRLGEYRFGGAAAWVLRGIKRPAVAHCCVKWRSAAESANRRQTADIDARTSDHGVKRARDNGAVSFGVVANARVTAIEEFTALMLRIYFSLRCCEQPGSLYSSRGSSKKPWPSSWVVSRAMSGSCLGVITRPSGFLMRLGRGHECRTAQRFAVTSSLDSRRSKGGFGR